MLNFFIYDKFAFHFYTFFIWFRLSLNLYKVMIDKSMPALLSRWFFIVLSPLAEKQGNIPFINSTVITS